MTKREYIKKRLMKISEKAYKANLQYVVCFYEGPWFEIEINERLGYFEDFTEATMFCEKLCKEYSDNYTKSDGKSHYIVYKDSWCESNHDHCFTNDFLDEVI